MVFNIFDIIVFVAIAIILIILVRRMPEEKKMPAGQSKAGRKWKWKLPVVKFELPNFFSKEKKEKLEKAEQKTKETPAQPLGLDKTQLQQADELLSRGKIDEAEKIYIKLAAAAPDDPRIFNRLGAVYLKQKNYANARDSFLQALRIDDTKGSRHYNLAMAYMGMGVTEKAKVSLKKALEIEPGKEKYKKALAKLDV